MGKDQLDRVGVLFLGGGGLWMFTPIAAIIVREATTGIRTGHRGQCAGKANFIFLASPQKFFFQVTIRRDFEGTWKPLRLRWQHQVLGPLRNKRDAFESAFPPFCVWP